MTTNQMAREAWQKAKDMGWEARVKYDQSDVLDWASVVAWAPGSTRARYITFIEGSLARKGWLPVKEAAKVLERQDAYAAD